MKKRMILFSLVLTLAVTLCACGEKKGISLKEKTDVLSMKVDEKYTIKLDYDGKDPVQWTSNDEAIAVVSPDGTVSAVGNGITTVTAKAEESFVHVGVIVGGNGDYTDEFGNVVEVFDQHSDITEIVVGVKGGSKSDVTINAAKDGDTFTLRAYTVPSDSTDKIAWRTSDSKVVRVDEKGVMKIVGKGMTTISAYAPNGVKGEMIVRVK